MSYKRLTAVTFVTSLLVLFQNCAMDAQHTGSTDASFSSSSCEASMQTLYRQTYYPVFKANCVSCHADGGESGRYFASSNFSTAFASFMSIGRQTIESKAQDSGHKPPHTGPQHTPMIQAYSARWQAAEDQVAECKGSATVETTDRSDAAIYSNPTTPPWVKMTWRLLTDVKKANLQGKFYLEVSIEVRRYRVTVNGTPTDMGYEFRAPRARVVDDGNSTTPLPSYRLRGLHIMLNDALLSQFTYYGSLDVTTNSATESLMSASGTTTAPAVVAINSADKFALRFDSIGDGTGSSGDDGGDGGDGVILPTRVSYADLISSNQLLGVFSQNCFGCHSGGSPSGGLNLTNYAAAVAAASNISSRMNNVSRPMPPSGILTQEKRDIVGIWISGGTPQN